MEDLNTRLIVAHPFLDGKSSYFGRNGRACQTFTGLKPTRVPSFARARGATVSLSKNP